MEYRNNKIYVFFQREPNKLILRKRYINTQQQQQQNRESKRDREKQIQNKK